MIFPGLHFCHKRSRCVILDTRPNLQYCKFVSGKHFIRRFLASFFYTQWQWQGSGFELLDFANA